VNAYLLARYGDPCRGCGYDWAIEPPAAGAVVDSAADRYEALLADCHGRERDPELAWDAGSYVCHVADNTRIWAERVAGAALGGGEPVAPYDEDALAAARSYGGVALAGGLWSLRRSVGDWQAAMALAAPERRPLQHPDQGALPLDEVLRIVAHEVHHHALDVERILAADVRT
jgi:hypothetical protein